MFPVSLSEWRNRKLFLSHYLKDETRNYYDKYHLAPGQDGGFLLHHALFVIVCVFYCHKISTDLVCIIMSRYVPSCNLYTSFSVRYISDHICLCLLMDFAYVYESSHRHFIYMQRGTFLPHHRFWVKLNMTHTEVSPW